MADLSEMVGAPKAPREYVAPTIEVLGTVEDTLGDKGPGPGDDVGFSFGGR